MKTNAKASNETLLGQNANSPKIDKDVTTGIFFNMPEEILWGNEVPIYGYLKNPEEVLHVGHTGAFGVNLFAGDGTDSLDYSGNFNLGNPAIRSLAEPFKILAKQNQIYFNTFATNIYQVLEPGFYNISISHYNLVSQTRRLKVVPSGWRKEISDFLAREICSGDLYKNLKQYLEHFEVQVDITGNDISQTDSDLFLKKLWDKGFKNYKASIKPNWVAGMKNEAKLDHGVGLYTKKLVAEKCPKRKEPYSEDSVILIYSGIKKFEADIK